MLRLSEPVTREAVVQAKLPERIGERWQGTPHGSLIDAIEKFLVSAELEFKASYQMSESQFDVFTTYHLRNGVTFSIVNSNASHFPLKIYYGLQNIYCGQQVIRHRQTKTMDIETEIENVLLRLLVMDTSWMTEVANYEHRPVDGGNGLARMLFDTHKELFASRYLNRIDPSGTTLKDFFKSIDKVAAKMTPLKQVEMYDKLPKFMEKYKIG